MLQHIAMAIDTDMELKIRWAKTSSPSFSLQSITALLMQVCNSNVTHVQ